MAFYSYALTAFPNNKVNLDLLTKEIQNSSIIIGLDHIDSNPQEVFIYFKSDLSVDEKNTLDSIIANHSGEPLLRSEIVKVEVITEHSKYVESGNTTQSFYCAESIIIDVSAGDIIKTVDYEWPFDIALKNATMIITSEMIGDELSIEAAPNTLVGVITQNVSIGDSSIYVTDTVIQNAKRGYWCNVYPTGTEISRICLVDGNYIGICPTSSMNLNAGTYLSITPKIIPYAYFNSVGTLEIGKTIQMGQRVPKGEKIRIKYKNNNATAKKISWFIEYLY